MTAFVRPSGILGVLEDAGIDVRGGGKLICPHCGKRHVSVSRSKGIAKCFAAGCSGFWSIHGGPSPAEERWAAFLVGALADDCQEWLPDCQLALDYLEHRELPTDRRWLIEQDLGAVPSWLDVGPISAEARRLWNEERRRRVDQIRDIELAAKGNGTKAVRAAEGKVERLQAEMEAEEKALNHALNSILPCLTGEKWRDAIVYIYRDAAGRPFSLNIRQFVNEPGERHVMRLQPYEGKRGVFGAEDAFYTAGEGWKPGMPALTVVEGEHNLLSLRAAVRRWGLNYFLPAIAVGGKNGADVACIRDLVGSDEPLLIYDNDTIDSDTGGPGGYDLVDDLSNLIYCKATTTPTKDLDDYLKAHPAISPQNVRREIFESALPVPLKIETVHARVAAYLKASDMEANARQIAVTDIIVSDVKRRTQLYNVDGYAMLVRPDGRVRAELIPARHGEPSFQAFMREYGLGKKEWLDAAGQAINIEAAKLSTPRKELHSLSCWQDGRLYINCYEGSMVRIAVTGTKTVLDRVPTGTDGILMQRYAADLHDVGQKVRPWLDDDVDLASIPLGSLRHRQDSLLDRHILSMIEYAEYPEVQKDILKSWLMSVFFLSSHRNRTIPMMEGAPGAGKTALGAQVGHLLLGPNFTVTNAPTTDREVAELMTGTPFVVFDEWDAVTKPVEAAIKHLTTGGKHRRRELYTTSKVVELSCDAAVMVTTNANSLRQVGSARRFLVIPVAARQKELGERVYQAEGDHLIPQLMTARTQVWRELLGDLAACVLALRHSDPATKTSFSMSDFGVFVQRIADCEGWGDDAHRLFVRAEKKQEEEAAQAQVLVEPFTQLLTAEPKHAGQFRSAREWSDLLHPRIADYDIKLKSLITPGYVAWACKTHGGLFERTLGMISSANRHTKTKAYAFRLPDPGGGVA